MPLRDQRAETAGRGVTAAADRSGRRRAGQLREVFPEGDEPGAGEPFAVVLDRYSKPWYAGRGDPDDAAFDEALTKLWAIEYDCPE